MTDQERKAKINVLYDQEKALNIEIAEIDRLLKFYDSEIKRLNIKKGKTVKRISQTMKFRNELIKEITTTPWEF